MMSRDFRQVGPAMNPYQGMAGLHIWFKLELIKIVNRFYVINCIFFLF